jgi:hypothetical protein
MTHDAKDSGEIPAGSITRSIAGLWLNHAGFRRLETPGQVWRFMRLKSGQPTARAYAPDMHVDEYSYRLYVDARRSLLVRVYGDGRVEAAVRPSAEYTWGPPIELREERVG